MDSLIIIFYAQDKQFFWDLLWDKRSVVLTHKSLKPSVSCLYFTDIHPWPSTSATLHPVTVVVSCYPSSPSVLCICTHELSWMDEMVNGITLEVFEMERTVNEEELIRIWVTLKKYFKVKLTLKEFNLSYHSNR